MRHFILKIFGWIFLSISALYTLTDIYKNIFVSKGSVVTLMNDFKKLSEVPNLDNLKVGIYNKNYDNANTFSALKYLVVNHFYQGIDYDGKTIFVLKKYIQSDKGIISIEKSKIDDKKCVSVTFSDRKYEIRFIDSIKYDKLLNIVWNIDKTDILDIHTLFFDR